MKLTRKQKARAPNDKDVDLEANSEADTDWLRDKDSLKRNLRSLTDAVSDDS